MVGLGNGNHLDGVERLDAQSEVYRDEISRTLPPIVYMYFQGRSGGVGGGGGGGQRTSAYRMLP